MAQSQTTASRLARIERVLETLVSAQAPAKAAPATAKAKQPSSFFTDVIVPRAAAKVACEIHDPESCQRRFSPISRGRENHVAGPSRS